MIFCGAAKFQLGMQHQHDYYETNFLIHQASTQALLVYYC